MSWQTCKCNEFELRTRIYLALIELWCKVSVRAGATLEMIGRYENCLLRVAQCCDLALCYCEHFIPKHREAQIDA